MIIVTDVYGHELVNAQLIADQFAANGYFTVIPDLFDGDACPNPRPASFDLPSWLAKHGKDKVDPIVAKTIEELRGKYGAKKVNGVGYCFGAKYVTRALRKGQFDAGYGAHPSFVDADELKAIEGPMSISAAGMERLFQGFDPICTQFVLTIS